MSYSMPYTLEQVLEVEQSYAYAPPVRSRPAAPDAIRTLPVALLAGLFAASSIQSSATPLTRTELEHLTHQTLEATTESTIFRQVVRQQNVAGATLLLPLHPVLAPALEPEFALPDLLDLGDYDYYDEVEMLPLNEPMTLVQVHITNTTWAEPEMRDLETEFSYLPDDFA